MSGKRVPVTIKFKWNTRSCSTTKDSTQGSSEEASQGSSRGAKYVRSMKANAPEKYKEHKQLDAKRKKVSYVSIDNRSQSDKQKQRQNWAEIKRKQRAKNKRSTDDGQSLSGREKQKRFKDMNTEEKNEYFKMKMRLSRMKISKQKKSCEKKKDRERKRRNTSPPDCTPCKTGDTEVPSSRSKATFYRRQKEVVASMPKSPHSYTKVVENLVYGEAATPRKVENMKKQGIRRNLEADIIAENIKANVSQLGKSQKDTDRQALHALVKACTSSQVPTTTEDTPKTKTSQGSKRVKKYLGVSRRTWSRVRKHKKSHIILDLKKKRKGITEDVIDTVETFWWSPAVSRPLPFKKRVKQGMPTHLLECSYSTAYRRFKNEHPDMKIGYVKFIQLRPKSVRHMRVSERNVCCCTRCENVKMKLDAINKLAASKSQAQLSSDEKSLSDMTLCHSTENIHPPKTCIDRKCTKCGVTNISRCLQPLLESDS